MNKKATVTTLLLLAVIGVAATLYFKRGSNINLKPFQALGEVAAQETAKLIGATGEIVVIVPGLGQSENQTQEAQMKSFRKELKRQRRVTIVATETINLLPKSGKKESSLRFLEPTLGGPPGLQPGQLSQAATNYSQAKAIVCFMGLPPLSESEIRALKQRGAKLAVVSEYRSDYKQLLKRQVLDLALVPRFKPLPAPRKEPRTLRDWFDQAYVVVTPENAQGLP